MNTEIVALSWRSNVPSPTPTLQGTARGYPTQLVPDIYSVARELFRGSRPWHFILLTLLSPMEQGLGDMKDSDWILHFEADFKDRHHPANAMRIRIHQ